ncbi:hypothetical protein CEUSTIGMA_g2724.t1 [Chlamydomonas eustigma]|uniref:EF-hand domain-containing protein n=1 Tax=Chlamydomonas eustigma TaxID=1157962 RepID=A0A250WX54_9CHLO|nr:hypothetical protein CEUSTIGMA_g2724.t1 [Chlamydomonas eustigma]|eukprot:GAX75279.1 hypothetical protein CEUSTIGMA_g2724.t1 [Chlamydomonas eustigma]
MAEAAVIVPIVRKNVDGESPEGISSSALIRSAATTDMLDSVISQYDKNGDGKIQPDELAFLMRDLAGGTDPSPEEVNAIMKECDANHDNLIDKEELKNVLTMWTLQVQRKRGAVATGSGGCNCVVC